MTQESRHVIAACLRSEIDAFRQAIDAKAKRDHYGERMFDIREDYLAKLQRALADVLDARRDSITK